MDPILFSPKSTIPIWGIVAGILIVGAITLFGCNEMMKKRNTFFRYAALLCICFVTVVVLISAINGLNSSKPINIYEDRITCDAGVFYYDSIEVAGIYPFPNARRYINQTYIGGGTEYRLMIVLPNEQFIIVGSDLFFAIDSVKVALDSAIARYRGAQYLEPNCDFMDKKLHLLQFRSNGQSSFLTEYYDIGKNRDVILVVGLPHNTLYREATGRKRLYQKRNFVIFKMNVVSA